MERAENFKKVLDVFFGGSPPQVGPSPSSNSSGSDSSSSGSSGVSVGTSDRWYPNYDPQFSLGKCINDAPAPNGRPSYATGVECCGKAYSGQASGACLNSLPQAPSGLGAPTGQDPGPQPTRKPVSPTSEAGMIISSQTFVDMEKTLESAKDGIDNKLFLYQTPAYQWVPSSVYRYADFMDSLYVMATEGVAGKKFYIGEPTVDNGHVYGLVNIAAFLAQVSVCIGHNYIVNDPLLLLFT